MNISQNALRYVDFFVDLFQTITCNVKIYVCGVFYVESAETHFEPTRPSMTQLFLRQFLLSIFAKTFHHRSSAGL